MKGETIMAKWFKRVLGAAAVGTAAAGALYYWKKTKVDTDEFEDDFEDDDFDLDDDLKPAADREYVSLNSASKGEAEEASPSDDTADTSGDAAADAGDSKAADSEEGSAARTAASEDAE